MIGQHRLFFYALFRGQGRRVAHRGAGAGDAVAEELNPFAISHTPTKTSHKPPGIEEARPNPDPMNSDSMPTRMTAYPIRPQIARSRGTSFALYNVWHRIKPATPRALMPIA